MDIQRISYEIRHNSEDYFFPLMLETKVDGKVVSSESFQTMEEIFQKVKEQDAVFTEQMESDLESNSCDSPEL